MITAYSKTTQSFIKVEHLINRGDYFGETYLIEIGMGFDTATFIVEAGNVQDALDVFVDSKFGHLVIIEDENLKDYDENYISYCGNEGKPCCLDEVILLERVKVNYFEKQA